MFCGTLLYWDLSALSLVGRLGSSVLGRKPPEVKCPRPVVRACLSRCWPSQRSAGFSTIHWPFFPLPVLSPWTCQSLSLGWTPESARVGRFRKGPSGE